MPLQQYFSYKENKDNIKWTTLSLNMSIMLDYFFNTCNKILTLTLDENLRIDLHVTFIKRSNKNKNYLQDQLVEI